MFWDHVDTASVSSTVVMERHKTAQHRMVWFIRKCKIIIECYDHQMRLLRRNKGSHSGPVFQCMSTVSNVTVTCFTLRRVIEVLMYTVKTYHGLIKVNFKCQTIRAQTTHRRRWPTHNCRRCRQCCMPRCKTKISFNSRFYSNWLWSWNRNYWLKIYHWVWD